MLKIWLYEEPDMRRGSYRIWIKYLSEYLDHSGYQSSCEYPQLASAGWIPDVVIMGKSTSLNEIQMIKGCFPNAKIGIINPTNMSKIILKTVDFGLVGSIEEKIFYADYLTCIFFPLIEKIPIHIADRAESYKCDGVRIGYHGNREHIESMSDNLKASLTHISKDHQSVNLALLYDFRKLGRADLKIPGLEVKHIQWELDSWLQVISSFHIGIVPSLIKPRILFSLGKRGRQNDYILRFKNTTNAGRLMVFNQLKIPAVAELTPSHAQVINNGVNGYLAHSYGSWNSSLTELITSVEKRKMIAEKAFSDFQNIYDIRKCCDQFMADLTNVFSERT